MEINEKRVYQQIRNFEKALLGYTYTEPLARYLTRFFKENKQMGSSDRRMTSRFCYNYFRLGNSFKNESIVDKLCFAEFLCESNSPVVSVVKPDLAKFMEQDLKTKISILQESTDFRLEQSFPFIEELSPDIDQKVFLESQLIQPNLFIRIKEGKEDEVKAALKTNGLTFTEISNQSLSLDNGSKLQLISKFLGDFEVQDLSSQCTINFMDAAANENWWDACAASGGKSLMFLDRYPKVKILVSDIRLSILRNLDERFEQAKIKQIYRKKIIDLSQSAQNALGNEQFDGIILDVPCSGSGTWGRTPEMIQQFDVEKLKSYTSLQKTIISNVIPHLKPGKPLVYITCSVYRQENEDVVQFIIDNFGFELEKMELIKGYDRRSDSMFAARLIRKRISS